MLRNDLVVDVAGLPVHDLSREQLVDLVAGEALQTLSDKAALVFALHVGGLLHRQNAEFRTALSDADIVYADGTSVVKLARLRGARHIERCVTTDVGWAFLEAIRERLGRPVRLALVGGPMGLAEQAAAVLSARNGASIVLTEHGFHDAWQGVIEEIRTARPDVVLIGMGAPREMIWAWQHSRKLSGALVVTCGGWFGYLAGHERRAPKWLSNNSLEWLFRLAQNPRRLLMRYVRGAWVFLRLSRELRQSPRG